MLCSTGKNIYVPLLKYKILMLIVSSSCNIFYLFLFVLRDALGIKQSLPTTAEFIDLI